MSKVKLPMTIRLSTELGLVLDDPGSTEIETVVDQLGPGNAYVLIERFDEGPWAAAFAQAAVPSTSADPWIVEYRQGADQYQALAADPGTVKEFLVKYAHGADDWQGNLAWSLLMSHVD